MEESRFLDALEAPPPLRVGASLCSWSDLLGFGHTFVESRWWPDDAAIEALRTRLFAAQTALLRTLLPNEEVVLILNDGMVRCRDVTAQCHADLLSYWFRACVMAHIAICRMERRAGYPGSRTVISFGRSIQSNHPEFRFDDFVYTWSKPDPTTPSRLASFRGNPVVVFNPTPLQINLAFARAYLLDAAGSKHGLAGPAFYLDESVLDFLRTVAQVWRKAKAVLDEGLDGRRLFALLREDTDRRYHLGFVLDEPGIPVVTNQLSTVVYRLRAFYPCDEDIGECRFELDA